MIYRSPRLKVMSIFLSTPFTKMIDYQISVRIRVNERHPKEWIVDALYDNLDRKHQEDIIEWYVTETNKKEAKRPRKTNKKEDKK